MIESLEIEKEIAFYLTQMEKAMPSVLKQVSVYEKKIKAKELIKNPILATEFKHV